MRGDPIGAPLPRVEGRDKVTGKAVYTADVRQQGVAHAVLVTSAISSGRVRGIDTRPALDAPGVLAVITHRNRPEWKGVPTIPYLAESRLPLTDDVIHFGNQCIGVVVAETRQQAEYAAGLVRVDYERRRPVPGLDAGLADAYVPEGPYADRFPVHYERGSVATRTPVTVEAGYRTSALSHAPMEPSVTLARWESGTLIVHDSTQSVVAHRPVIATAFGLPESSVRLISSLVGGGFGNKSYLWAHTLLAPLASMMVHRPVRLVLTRKQVFTGTGHMPELVHRVRLGADEAGKLLVIEHHTVNPTSPTDDRAEPAIQSTPALYAVPNLLATAKVTKVNVGTSGAMRTPGDTPGQFATECAMDELAYRVGIDPVELRRRNISSDAHPHTGKPWGGNRLLECLDIGAGEFGWDARDARPASMRDGRDLVGYGMAVAIRAEHSAPAVAAVRLSSDGGAEVLTATQEIGGGSLTTMVQIAAAGLGMAPARVRISAGDSDLPPGAPTFGSMTSGSTGSAVQDAAGKVRAAAIRLAVSDPGSPLHGTEQDAVAVEDGRMFVRDRPRRGETYAELLTRHGIGVLADQGTHLPPAAGEEPFALATFAAHFTEVRIDVDLPRVRVVRHIGVFDCGRVLNRATAANQARGGMIFAMGGALMEKLDQDPVSGRFTNSALTDYHVPVHADIGDVRAVFVDKAEVNAHPVGAKGLGEICSIGVAPAVANAVFHATGTRIRHLPLTPEKLL
ncbi:xanthine dehydrogenase family protein molybdopterin-binding subunit [Saccharomonospora sp. NPDC006951]